MRRFDWLDVFLSVAARVHKARFDIAVEVAPESGTRLAERFAVSKLSLVAPKREWVR
jgi:hypothetical protein